MTTGGGDGDGAGFDADEASLGMGPLEVGGRPAKEIAGRGLEVIEELVRAPAGGDTSSEALGEAEGSYSHRHKKRNKELGGSDQSPV